MVMEEVRRPTIFLLGALLVSVALVIRFQTGLAASPSPVSTQDQVAELKKAVDEYRLSNVKLVESLADLTKQVQVLAQPATVLAAYPKGTILPFAGAAVAVPAGWHICDGTNGTVDLVNRLPIGAGNDGQVGRATEGSATHAHTYGGGTTSDAMIGGFTPASAFQAGNGNNLKNHVHTYPGGTTQPGSSLPPVTRVYFIQKIQ
jgi:hypothetical protein